MADFTHTFTLTAVLDDGRTFTMNNTDVLAEIEGVWQGFALPGQDTINAPGLGIDPELPSMPILTLIQPKAAGANIYLENTNADDIRFFPEPGSTLVIHGTETFEISATAGDATLAEELNTISFNNGALAGGISYFILYGPTS